jgi:hypothetical protein
MERAVVIRGRLHGRNIELDEAVEDLEGEVEVSVRAITRPGTGTRLLEIIAAVPAGSRSKEDIDRQLDEERSGWDRRG